MTTPHVQTLVKNLTRRRRLGYIPPNGKLMSKNETHTVYGVLETLLYLSKDVEGLASYYHDLSLSRIEITKVGYGEAGTPSYFVTTIGDGGSTVFDVDAGFDTSLAQVYLYDLVALTPIDFYQLERGVPNANSIRFTLTPAPALNSIQVFIFQ